MAKLSRYKMNVFGSQAGADQLSTFGSLQAGAPATWSGVTIDPDKVQALSNYLEGWGGAVMAGNSPTFEDFNSICYLFCYMAAYSMQRGIPEWLSTDTYYKGSICTDSDGFIYRSLQDDNTNNVLSDISWWKPYRVDTGVVSIEYSATGYNVTSEDDKQIFLVDSTNGAETIQLPDPASVPDGFYFVMKDSGGVSASNPITVKRNGGEKIDGLAADYVCEANYGTWSFVTNNTDWFII